MAKQYSSNAQLLISKKALRANIRTYRTLIGDKPKLLLMVKANGYGTDSMLISKAVEGFVDYLGAAYSSNAYALKDNGITTPIMVMAPEPGDLEKIADYQLEPVLYSLEMIQAATALGPPINAHIEIDSGMKRLGIKKEEIKKAAELLDNSQVDVLSVFSHLSSPSEGGQDDFTHAQAAYFNDCFAVFNQKSNANPYKHLVSSGGIKRFPQYHYDMVRLGIGFYGFDPSGLVQDEVKAMATLQAKVLQIIEVKKEESIGYSRKGHLPYDGRVATISIGYGDGYLRVFGNGMSQVLINGKRAKTVGNICMDLTMIDVTNIECKIGDIVELVGTTISTDELAKISGTIPYEILTNISPRVERILVE